MDKFRKVLFLTHHYLNDNSGGSFASRAYINAFADSITENLTVLYPDNSKQPIGINPNVSLCPVSYNLLKYKKAVRLFRGRLSRFDLILEDKLNSEKYDLIVFDNSKTASGCLKILEKNPEIKVITIHHNVETQYLYTSKNIILNTIIKHIIESNEQLTLTKSSLNLVLSDDDKSSFLKRAPNINVATLGVFEYFLRDKYNKRPDNHKRGSTFVITGNLSSQQNVISILNWLDVYYPVLKKVSPDSRLIVSGRNPSLEFVIKCQKLNVDVIPNPVEMDEVIERADYYICPTDIGGGVKLRVMDAFRNGIPVITHTVSERGYEPYKQAGCLFSYTSITDFELSLRSLLNSNCSPAKILETFSNNNTLESGISRLSIIIENWQVG